MGASKVKDVAKSFQGPLMHVLYTLQEPFKNELETLQEQQISASIGVDEMAKWFKSFGIASRQNGTVCLCLDPARLNQALNRAIHREPTLHDILP